jgi:hypothetical protein
MMLIATERQSAWTPQVFQAALPTNSRPRRVRRKRSARGEQSTPPWQPTAPKLRPNSVERIAPPRSLLGTEGPKGQNQSIRPLRGYSSALVDDLRNFDHDQASKILRRRSVKHHARRGDRLDRFDWTACRLDRRPGLPVQMGTCPGAIGLVRRSIDCRTVLGDTKAPLTRRTMAGSRLYGGRFATLPTLPSAAAAGQAAGATAPPAPICGGTYDSGECFTSTEFVRLAAVFATCSALPPSRMLTHSATSGSFTIPYTQSVKV